MSQRDHLAVNGVETVQRLLDAKHPLGALAAGVGEVCRPRSIEASARDRSRSPAPPPAPACPGAGDAALVARFGRSDTDCRPARSPNELEASIYFRSRRRCSP